MGIVIFAFAYFGKWLDEKYGMLNLIYSKTLTIVGVFLALYNVIRQVKQMNNDQ
jgi:hypothetical protein